MADTLSSGGSARDRVRVQIPFSAPLKQYTALMAVFYFSSCCIMNIKKYAYQGEII